MPRKKAATVLSQPIPPDFLRQEHQTWIAIQAVILSNSEDGPVAEMAALADFFREHESKLDEDAPFYIRLAYALQWSTERRTWPFVSPYRKYHHWATLRRGQHYPVCHHQLPRVLYSLIRPLPKGRIEHYRFRTTRSAFISLADAIHRLREVVTIEGEPL